MLGIAELNIRQCELISPLASRLELIIDIYAFTQFLFHYGKPQAVIKMRKSLDETQETNSCREKNEIVKKFFELNFISLQKPFPLKQGEKKGFLFFLLWKKSMGTKSTELVLLQIEL